MGPTGAGIYKMDTNFVITLVINILAGIDDNGIALGYFDFVLFNNAIYFPAKEVVHGRELWKVVKCR